jgi:hypothetical protein
MLQGKEADDAIDLDPVEKFEARLRGNIENGRFFHDAEWFLFMAKRMTEAQLRSLVLNLASRVEREAYMFLQLVEGTDGIDDILKKAEAEVAKAHAQQGGRS